MIYGSRPTRRALRMKLARSVVSIVSLAALLLVGSRLALAQKLRVAYTAFSGTFAILWVGKESGHFVVSTLE